MGRKKTKVVVAESSVTAGQMSDFWRMVGDGTIDGLNFGGFLQNPRKFAPATTTLARALNILGAGKVVTAEQAAKAWNVAASKSVVIRYSEAALRDAAFENTNKGADWRLVYVLGLWSLRELRALVGVDTAKQPCLYNNDWWLPTAEDVWATRRPTMIGYQLINFHGEFGSTSWANQDVQIRLMGDHFERADEVALTEAALTIYKVTGKYLLQGWYHWGRSETSDRGRVAVGRFGHDGWHVRRDGPCYDDRDYLRFCRSRKFS